MLLDTHIWIWAANGDTSRLGVKARRLLNRVGAAGKLSVSAMSVFEVAALHTAGRLQLAMPVEGWIRASIDRSGLRILDVPPAVATDAGLIPAAAMSDPIDRLLVATSRYFAIPLMTRDRTLLAYARSTRALTVVDASG